MTNEQKEQVRLLREKNIGYLAIANALDISVDAVRGYCRRNGLTGQRSNATRNDTSVGCCLEFLRLQTGMVECPSRHGQPQSRL